MRALIEYKGVYWLVIEKKEACPVLDCHESALCRDKCGGLGASALCRVFGPLVGLEQCAFKRVEQ